MEAYWDIYNYQEEKGIVQKIYDYIFENQFNFTFGHIKSSQVYSVEKLANLRPVDCDEKNYMKPMIIISMYNQLTGIHQYKRKAISIWTYFANICALGLTIYSCLTTVFGYIYSKNFDNYKVLEKMLSKDKRKNCMIKLKI